MSEELLVMHCAPTLAGIKTGNLFSIKNQPKEDNEDILCEIRRLNCLLASKGLRVLPIKQMKNRILVYVYRPAKLKKDFSDKKVYGMLREMGYPCEDPRHCIAYLAKKLKESPIFPHEIGLFLGYPPEDVQGFIENKAGHCKCAGCWKVYGDVERAQRKFAQYEKCRDVYYEKWKEGFSIEQLTVAG